MRIGLPKDKRRFLRPTSAQKKEPSVTRDIPEDKAKWTRCHGCGMPIKGHKWRVAPGVYECFRCHNE